MTIQYGLNQCGFPSEDLDQTCPIVAEAGYDGIEPNVEQNGLLTTESGRQRVREIIDRYDLSVPAISTISHWDYPLSSTDDKRREVGLQIGHDMIDAAVALDAEDVLIVPAVITPDTPYDEGYRRAVESVRELVDYADGQDVTVSIENVQNNFLSSPDAFVDFLNDADSAGRVQAYFDVGNGLRSGLPNRWLRTLNGHISKIHVKDWIQDAHRTTYPLQGDVNWKRVVEAVTSIGYDGWITAEVPPYPSYGERMPVQVLENLQFLFERSEVSQNR